MKALLPLLLVAMIQFTISAQPVVINEIYGGGGISGAVYKNDFIELYNTSSSVVPITGWSIQYASAAGSTWSAVPLTGEIAPHGYFLIQLASSGNPGQSLPTPDVSGNINMNASTGGKVALVSQAAALSASTCPTDPNILDLVGYGNASCFSGAGSAPSPSGTRSISRSGGLNTHDNSTDFSAGTPTPNNSGRMDVTITFDPLPIKTYGDQTFSLHATPSLDLPISYSIDNPAVASIVGNEVTIHAAGTATLTATLNSTYFFAPPQSQLLTVAKAPLSVSVQDITILAGESIPGFTIIYVGFIGADDVGILDALPMATTTATSGSPAGNYPITLSPGQDNNYEISVSPGTLTINNPPVLPPVYLLSPADGTTSVASSMTATARLVNGASLYTIQISSSPLFNTQVIEKTGSRVQSFTGLALSSKYYARVKTNLDPLFGKTTSFTTGSPEQFSYVTSPANHATKVGLTVNVSANLIPGATVYTIELSTSPDFTGPSYSKTGLRTQSFTNLMLSTQYFTRVKTNLSENWGSARSFTTGSASDLGYITSPSNNAINVSYLPTITINNINAGGYTVQLSTSSDFAQDVTELTSTVNKITLTTMLAYDTKYFARVKSDLSEDQWGPVRAFTTGNPSKFAYTVGPVNGITNVNLGVNVTSNLVPGAIAYSIELNSDPAFGESTRIEKTSASRAINFLLSPDTRYYSRVKTDLSSETWGAIRSFTTGNPVSLAYVVSPAQAASNVNFVTTVTANTIPGATAYTIELNTSPDFTGVSQVKTSSKPGISFTLNEGQSYFSRVKTSLDNSWGNNVRSFTTGTAISLAFVASPKNTGTGVPTTVKVIANPVGNAKHYTIELNTMPDFSEPGIIIGSNSRVINFTGLQPATTYYSRVQTNLAPDQWGLTKSFTTAVTNTSGRSRTSTSDWEAEVIVVDEATENELKEESITGLNIKAFPNPFTHMVSLSNEDAVYVEFVVSDLAGKTIQQGRLAPKQSATFGEDWPDGLLIVKIFDPSRSAILRVIKMSRTIRD